MMVEIKMLSKIPKECNLSERLTYNKLIGSVQEAPTPLVHEKCLSNFQEATCHSHPWGFCISSYIVLFSSSLSTITYSSQLKLFGSCTVIKFILCKLFEFHYRYPWGKVKLLLAQKLENVIEEYMTENPDESVPLLPNVENVSFADMKQRLLTNIGKFNE